MEGGQTLEWMRTEPSDGGGARDVGEVGLGLGRVVRGREDGCKDVGRKRRYLTERVKTLCGSLKDRTSRLPGSLGLEGPGGSQIPNPNREILRS